MVDFGSVSLLGVIIATVVATVLGMFWYSPAGFGKQWMSSLGFTKKDLAKAKSKGMGKIYFINLIATLVLAYVLSMFVKGLSASGFMEGAVVGFFVWFGFIATILLGSILWEGKPVQLYWINAGYQLITLLLMGGIVASF